MAADPDVILLPNTAYKSVDEFAKDARFSQLRAVKEGHVYVINDIIITRPGSADRRGAQGVAGSHPSRSPLGTGRSQSRPAAPGTGSAADAERAASADRHRRREPQGRAGRNRRRTYRLVMAILAAVLVAAVIVSIVTGAAGLSPGAEPRAPSSALIRQGSRRHRLLPRLGAPPAPRPPSAPDRPGHHRRCGAVDRRRVVPGHLPQPSGRAVPAGGVGGRGSRCDGSHRLEASRLARHLHAAAPGLCRGDPGRLPRLPSGHLRRPHAGRIAPAFRSGGRLHAHRASFRSSW